VLYSGTVSAAMEGLLEGIPSVALSLASHTSHDFQPAADFAVKLLQQLSEKAIAPNLLLNVNIPNLPTDQILGAKITRQGLRRYIEQFQKRQDPRGRTYYWLSGEAIEELPQPEEPNIPPDVPTDVQAIQEGFITMTPLQYTMNDVRHLPILLQENWTVEG
jgi:5'-nucleotidase